MSNSEFLEHETRLARNDRLVLDATAVVMARGGWPSLSLTAVAVQAGLSRRAVQNRFSSKSALAVGLWDASAEANLRTALQRLLYSAGLLEGSTPDELALAEAMRKLGISDEPLLGAAEILVSSPYSTEIGSAVRDTLGATVRTWCTTSDATLNAQRGYLLIVGLGLLLDSHRSVVEIVNWHSLAETVLAALAAKRLPSPLPTDRALHMSADIEFASGDSITDALLQSVLSEVGRRGFDDTTTSQIASAAGYTEGVLFKRYESKLDLFLDATRRQTALGMETNAHFFDRLARLHGAGIASAILMRESMHPDVWSQRSTAREQIRLSWRHPDVRDALEDSLQAVTSAMLLTDADSFGSDPTSEVHFEHAVGLGLTIFPVLLPDAADLPFDVVTVAMTQPVSESSAR